MTIISRVNLTICVSLYLNDRNIGEFFVNVGHDGVVNARVDGTCEQCNDALGVGYPNICLLLFGLTCSSLPCSYFALLKLGLNFEPPSFVCLEIAMVFFGFRV
jgi:hypothetical protein